MADYISRTSSESTLTMTTSEFFLFSTSSCRISTNSSERPLTKTCSMEKQDEEAFGNPPNVLRVHIGMHYSSWPPNYLELTLYQTTASICFVNLSCVTLILAWLLIFGSKAVRLLIPTSPCRSSAKTLTHFCDGRCRKEYQVISQWTQVPGRPFSRGTPRFSRIS